MKARAISNRGTVSNSAFRSNARHVSLVNSKNPIIGTCGTGYERS